jgi:hypothetical protein
MDNSTSSILFIYLNTKFDVDAAALLQIQVMSNVSLGTWMSGF